MTYLFRHPKTGVYYFRRAVPRELQAIVGKTAIKKSLDTKDVAEAKRRAHPHAVEADRELEKARTHLTAKPQSELADAEINRLAAIYLHDRLDEDEEIRREGTADEDDLYKQLRVQVEAAGVSSPFSDDDATAPMGLSSRAFYKMQETFDIVLPELQEALARGDSTIVQEEVDDLLWAHGIKLDNTSPSYRKLSMAVLKASVRAMQARMQRHQGEVVDTPPAPAAPILRVASTRSGDGLDVQAMFEKWLAERKPAAKTVLDYTTAFRRFVELHGSLPVYEITKSHVRAYKAALLKLPRSLSHDMRSLTVPQLLERLERSPAPDGATLAAGTVNKAIGGLEAVFGWCAKQGYLDDHLNWSNPASDMKIHNPASDEENRLPYDADDLKVIFNSPVFRDGIRPRGGGGEAVKWLPLIALFSGAREEEIGQALVTDVKEEDGIRYLHINTLDKDAGKRVKNRSSRRKLPLHPELLRCGLLEYVEERRKNGDTRLFPQLRPSATGHVTANWSKWWGRYSDEIGITDRRKVFHSFRHTFKRACRAARIEEELHDALTGHTNANVGRRYGSDGTSSVPLEVLAEAIAKVTYRGLDLSHLHVSQGERIQQAS